MSMNSDPIRDLVAQQAPELLPEGTAGAADNADNPADTGAFASTYAEYESPDAARTAAVKKALRAVDTERTSVDTNKVMKWLQRGAFNPDTLDAETAEAVQMFSHVANRSSLNPRGAGALPDNGNPRDPIGARLR